MRNLRCISIKEKNTERCFFDVYDLTSECYKIDKYVFQLIIKIKKVMEKDGKHWLKIYQHYDFFQNQIKWYRETINFHVKNNAYRRT